MQLLDGRHSVMDLKHHGQHPSHGASLHFATYGMCGRKPAGLKAKPRQERVSFDDRLQRRGNHVGFARLVRLSAIREQDFLALGADRGRDGCLQPAAEVERVLALARFDVRRDGVTHPRGEEARGCARDDGRVDEHDRGVLREECVAIELARRAVEHRERRAGSVRRGSRGEHRDLHGEPVRDHLGGVDGLAAAERDDEVGALSARVFGEPRDLLASGFAAEDRAVDCERVLFEGGYEIFAGCGVTRDRVNRRERREARYTQHVPIFQTMSSQIRSGALPSCERYFAAFWMA